MKVHIRLLGDTQAVEDVKKLLEAVYKKTVDATGEHGEDFIDATGRGSMSYLCFEVIPLNTDDQVDT